jgi:glyoxylase-like metal-dependent hydrolase (beta-lactamase superfamily II)
MEIPDLSKEPYAIAEVVSPLIRRVLARNASPFSYTGTQTYIIGHGEVAVIDPGPLGDDPAHVGALLRLLGHPNSAHPEPVEGSGLRQAQPERVGVAPERILAIMCTHTHRDHSPAAAPLAAATGAPVIGCAPLVLSDDGPRADAGFDPTYAPDRVLEDGESVTGPGWTLTALATPGHTSNHLCFALAEEKALFSGDHVMGWSTTVVSPPDGDMADYMRSLALLLERDDAVYYAAHGAPIDKPQRLVRGMMGHRKQREGQILRLLERGIGAIPDMVREMYKGIDVRLYGAAGRSVLAHLIDLRDRGRVSAEGDSWIIAA